MGGPGSPLHTQIEPTLPPPDPGPWAGSSPHTQIEPTLLLPGPVAAQQVLFNLTPYRPTPLLELPGSHRLSGGLIWASEVSVARA